MTRTRMSGSNGWIKAIGTAGLGAILAMGAAGCKSKPAQAPIVTGSDTGGDPAAANLAPVNGQSTQVMGSSSSYAPQQQGESYQQQPAPVTQGGDQYSYNAPAPEESAGQAGAPPDQGEYQSSQPPPPLPDYDQPPAPDPNYLWTPGYWAWGPSGYYWVPGVWAAPPYYGALWTPPYWGWYGNHYYFHGGYWGPHIGFYGGVDYGFGYIGVGFFGGYWRGHDFVYNRAVTNIGHINSNYVYNHTVVYNGRQYGAHPTDRVSYNGGRGGLNMRPGPQQLAANQEPHVRAVAEQTQVRQQAAQNRQQTFSQNHGNPAQSAVDRPVGNAHSIAETPRAVQQTQQRETQLQQRSAPEQQRAAQPGRTEVQPQARPETQPQARPGAQPQARPAAPQARQAQPEARPQTQPQARPQAQQQARPQAEPQARPQARPQAEPRTNAAPTERSAPQAERRPAPEARPAEPAARPQAAPHPQAAHPAPDDRKPR